MSHIKNPSEIIMPQNTKPEILKKWIKLASSIELKRLSELSESSVSYIYELARGETTARSDIAGRLEDASRIMHRESKRRLPILYRSLLSEACATCPYSKKCRGTK